MSTIFSVLLMIGSLFYPNQKTAIIAFSVMAFVVAGYRVWAKTDRALEAEKQKNTMPHLVGEILEVQAKIDPSSWFAGTGGEFIADYFVFVRLRVCNQNPAETTVSKFDFLLENKSPVNSISTSNAKRNELHPNRLKSDEKLDDLASMLKEPLRRGVEREGWLEFLVPGLPGEKNKNDPHPPVTLFRGVRLTDAFGGTWVIKGLGGAPTVSIHVVI